MNEPISDLATFGPLNSGSVSNQGWVDIRHLISIVNMLPLTKMYYCGLCIVIRTPVVGWTIGHTNVCGQLFWSSG